MKQFWNFKPTEEEVELRIEGDIVDDSDSWLYEWLGDAYASPNSFREELANYKGKNLTVWIDSYGGNVFAAAGIYNALKEHKGGVTVKIDGKAMSAATVIAMAGDKVLMSPTAMFMVHNPLTYAAGYASDLRKAADVLDSVKESIVNAYQIKTGLSRKQISDLMDNETYMSAKLAQEKGFIDEIMYVESPEVLNFTFDRGKVLNSTSESIRRMAEKLNNQPEQPETPIEEKPDEIDAKPIQTQFQNLLNYFEMNERSL